MTPTMRVPEDWPWFDRLTDVLVPLAGVPGDHFTAYAIYRKKETPDMSAMTHRGRAEYEARLHTSVPGERGVATSRPAEPPPTMGNRPIGADREPDGELRAGLFLMNSNLESIGKAVALLEGAIELVLVPDGPATAKGDAPEPPPPATAIGADLRQLNETAARIFDRLTAIRYRVSI